MRVFREALEANPSTYLQNPFATKKPGLDLFLLTQLPAGGRDNHFTCNCKVLGLHNFIQGVAADEVLLMVPVSSRQYGHLPCGDPWGESKKQH